jgi:hypothetical protein
LLPKAYLAIYLLRLQFQLALKFPFYSGLYVLTAEAFLIGMGTVKVVLV